MSLADLYKNDTGSPDRESSSDDEEYVDGQGSNNSNGESDDGSDADNDEHTEAEEPKEEKRAAEEQQKRRIDDIWQEMNAPSSKAARIEAAESPEDSKEKPKEENKEAKSEEEPKQVVERKGPRRASKFSKMAAMVEQRRARRENTLEAARKQWTGFVDAAGIREDLNRANKDGFVERQEFLRRVDERTYQNTKSRKQK
ncbi:hypothetical protein GGI25_000075 [Coemansia spiralis]|uniref:BCNT-C domain-containing protein n=2 Tax=Coemansia TaxID=4863 RepID=A0A9W8GCS9_9FUNG|nr:hypothetical protein BX070DRAFT_218793 [Coemansia spiralis]KAJ1992574.1 hypothetical protein EDC05_002720 [Coemansia umbellata]KAJ2623046.1 hypothetical protein GGI26_002655 [Coemansia sp. RSA 1358]KAJ2681120.1 hypothetical protein GGI25_000075 [Coemansia spiralis]